METDSTSPGRCRELLVILTIIALGFAVLVPAI
jgi:hypothetical protein